ncbi:MAG: hypothetical protein LBT88_06625 [Oscillospiraceae bacterium]|jgi:hypothetical protein|nr:hypothetical protein [Oscillospiraceae bacterium]
MNQQNLMMFPNEEIDPAVMATLTGAPQADSGKKPKPARNEERLHIWQDRLNLNAAAFAGTEKQIREYEALYAGTDRVEPMTDRGRARIAPHVRNVVAENIESTIDSTIPQPKVTCSKKANRGKARRIENMLRNLLDRLPMETMNDAMERWVPVNGGGYWMVEWDNDKNGIAVTNLHSLEVVPQDGVYTQVEDSDYIIIKRPQTKSYIKKKYGVSVADEEESEPDVKGTRADAESTAKDMVTQYIAYYRNDDGGIGMFSWVNDIILADYENYQGRIIDGEEQKYEEIFFPINTAGGEVIMPPARIPYFSPNMFPVILEKSVSVYGKLLGESDAARIRSAQNAINRVETKIIRKLIRSGSKITKPATLASLRIDEYDGDTITVHNLDEIQQIKVLELEGNIQQDLQFLAQLYEEARQQLGITDSFQGRRDSTAQSGIAKQFAAAQSAGRLESRREMKRAAFAQLFEIMFKFMLAYSDDPVSVVSNDVQGQIEYDTFDRYDFLIRQPDGSYEWDIDDYTFSCDNGIPLAQNRSALWQETFNFYQAGLFTLDANNPSQIESILMAWSSLDNNMYPGAADNVDWVRGKLEEALALQQQRQQAEQAAQQQAAQAQEAAAQAQNQQAQNAAAAEARGAEIKQQETALAADRDRAKLQLEAKKQDQDYALKSAELKLKAVGGNSPLVR